MVSAPAGASFLLRWFGIRGMERGTLSEEREPDGSERFASMELLRLAFPRRVFTLSQTEYVIDRIIRIFGICKHKQRDVPGVGASLSLRAR